MAYARMEPGFSRHIKRTKSGPEASWLWTCSVDYCTEFHTDGFVDEAAVPGLCPALRGAKLKRCIEALVAVKSWVLTDGGYFVHGYLDHNVTAERIEKDRQAARERYHRWQDKRRSNDDPTALETPEQHDSQSVSQSVGLSVSQHQKPVSGPRAKDSADAVKGWESVLAAVRVRFETATFKDPHVAKVLRVMGGITQLFRLNDRDTHPAAVNSERRRFVDLYDATEKDPVVDATGHEARS
jgi:hypothetical protein